MPVINPITSNTLTAEQAAKLAKFRHDRRHMPDKPNEADIRKAAKEFLAAEDAYWTFKAQCDVLETQGKNLSNTSRSKLAQLKAECDALMQRYDAIGERRRTSTQH